MTHTIAMYIQDMQSLMFIPSCCFSTSFINNNCTKFPLMISDINIFYIIAKKRVAKKSLNWIEKKQKLEQRVDIGSLACAFLWANNNEVSGTSMDGKKFLFCCMDIESSSTVMKNYFCIHKHSHKASQFQWIVWGWGWQQKKLQR